jgi:hypothetical protein
MTVIASQDREILQRLASDIVEIGSLPIQEEKAELWRRLNDMSAQGVSPRNSK